MAPPASPRLYTRSTAKKTGIVVPSLYSPQATPQKVVQRKPISKSPTRSVPQKTPAKIATPPKAVADPVKSPARGKSPARAKSPARVAKSPARAKSPVKVISPKSTSKSGKAKGSPTWGRWDTNDWQWNLVISGVFFFSPLFVFYVWVSINAYDGNILGPAKALFGGGSLYDFYNKCPSFTLQGLYIFVTWFLFQVVLAVFLPGKIAYGSVTPAGHKLPYKVNGLLAWVVSHIVFFIGVWQKWWAATIIADNFGSLLVICNAFGWLLSIAVYLKGLYFPTHAGDVKFSGNFIYDFFMGIEFNPRIGELFDFKLFMNGRPGIVAWTLINISFAAKQLQVHGSISNSMILVNVLEALYVLDFFYQEDWYLRTIDICHDHFGFYLAWGDPCWLPFMYTLQAQYLLIHPVVLNNYEVAIVLLLGFTGYYIFRAVNSQKDEFRLSNGKCLVWGKPAESIATSYTATDGTVHKTALLVSGYWGLARHFNYLGDLVLSLAYCLACGKFAFVPYFYFFYMVILLVVRVYRDDARCSAKYGQDWEKYKARVQWKIVPGVF